MSYGTRRAGADAATARGAAARVAWWERPPFTGPFAHQAVSAQPSPWIRLVGANMGEYPSVIEDLVRGLDLALERLLSPRWASIVVCALLLDIGTVARRDWALGDPRTTRVFWHPGKCEILVCPAVRPTSVVRPEVYEALVPEPLRGMRPGQPPSSGVAAGRRNIRAMHLWALAISASAGGIPFDTSPDRTATVARRCELAIFVDGTLSIS